MRAVHNTPIPADVWEFPIPDNCTCEEEMCNACMEVEKQLEKELLMTPEEIIKEVIRILRIDGELATDGQCLEMVGDLLDANGYGPVYPADNRTGDLGEYGNEYK
jgi:hypothetical protein